MPKKKKKQPPDVVLEAGKKAGRKAWNVFGEFKEFISRGNVTDMAVGIIVGTAFTAIVTSLVADVITPLIGIIMGGIDFTELSVTFKSFIFPEHNVVLNYGNFIQSIVRFFIIAVCVFFMVKAMNAFRRKRPAEEPKEPKIDEKIALLTEIRDLLKERNGDEVIPHSDPSENKSSD